MATSLGKPGTAASTIVGGSKIGLAGSDFYIKVIDGDFSYSSPDAESTGDGDTTPTHENNCLLYMDFNLRGAMIASQAIGVANLIVTTANPSASFTFDLTIDRKLSATVLIRDIVVRWNRRGQWVGVAMRGRATDVVPTEATV